MSQDEKAIRGLVAQWMAATARGDIEAVLNLMTDDALFLVPGQAPMDKAGFANAARAAAGSQAVIEGKSDIGDIMVDGDMACMWSHLTVVVTPPGASAVRHEGHTLTVLRRISGRWLLARDANLLVKVQEAVQ